MQQTRAFYCRVYLPWVRQKRIRTEPQLWYTGPSWWGTHEECFAAFPKEGDYPWGFYGEFFLQLRAADCSRYWLVTTSWRGYPRWCWQQRPTWKQLGGGTHLHRRFMGGATPGADKYPHANKRPFLAWRTATWNRGTEQAGNAEQMLVIRLGYNAFPSTQGSRQLPPVMFQRKTWQRP